METTYLIGQIEELKQRIQILEEDNKNYKELFWELQKEVDDMKFWLNERNLLQD